MEPDFESVVRNVTFYGDTPYEALIKAANYIKENGFEFNSGEIIHLAHCDELGRYLVSFDDDYRNDIKFKDIND